MREKLMAALKEAMKSKETTRVNTIRMVQSAIKDLEIANRTKPDATVTDGDIAQLLSKLVKQREESAKVYDEGGRPELAAKEREEIAIITGFMPKQLSDDEVTEAINAAIAETGAASIKDMGKVMAVLKDRFPGQMDFAKASGLIKAQLG
ncbi:GatB/YqeY domain-containing protein [Rhizobium sp. TRM95796]|uniref:GatB/YqeY domain-containing protein n=1 Tax=Rhizobium sp. TRM95796 TaxID=2979862 RepID=UPI0021E7CA00|nr:GatB/YqeY domain-containing protein [Rhizobium sp. TRM95796]MCV3764770.1 GatB/YqeY domain-containing protein [Rhizobium sp. TRM95796]